MTMIKEYEIRNWNKFQHFKDRKPPWIKLYRDILDDPEWHELKPDAAKALVMLWLVASETDGKLPPLRKLAFRLRNSESRTEQLLNELKHWLTQVDITTISERYHDDTPETETEKEGEIETEAKTETDARARKPGKFADYEIPDNLAVIENFRETWLAFLDNRKAKKAKATPKAQELLLKKLAERPADAVAALEMAITRNWTGFEWAWLDNARAQNAAAPKPTPQTPSHTRGFAPGQHIPPDYDYAAGTETEEYKRRLERF